MSNRIMAVVIQMVREVDADRMPPAKTPERRPRGGGPKPITSAFDDTDGYELTELGQKFVHYAMTELPPKIEFPQEGDGREE
jgi:hypothetical protein